MLKSVLIAAGTTWDAPATLSAAFLYEVGGGSGANPSDSGAGRPSGGPGSAEFCGGKPISITPGASYVVTIGDKGLGGIEFIYPIGGTPTVFDGHTALPGGSYRGGAHFGLDSCGDGGGCGGGLALSSGDGGSWGAVTPKQEAMHYFGGAAGGAANGTYINAKSSSNGGRVGSAGAGNGIGESGGPGGGSIWGATDGGNNSNTPNSPIRKANALANNYGAGAGGTGAGDGGADGGNGAGGCVILMWFE